MLENVRNVCVIGAGTMGSGIAAHLANLGFQVTLMDLTPESVREAFDRARRARPPHFYVPETAETVRLASIRDDLDLVREADWVCEAIIEKADAKRALFDRLEPLVREDAVVSTNTSGLEIGLLSEGRGERFRRTFTGTHFFNPPRYLKLLELIPTSDTDPAVIADLTRFLEERVARRVVVAKDTPGFIANRFGMWSMFHTVHVAERLGLKIEQVDAICGPFLGRPRSGAFRLNDLVGVDIMQDIAQNLLQRCQDDPHTGPLHASASLKFLLSKGWIGEKAGQGYYRKEGRELLSLDLHTLAYRQRQEPQLPSLAELEHRPLGERLRAGLELRDEVGEFLRAYLVPTLKYADYLKAEVSHNVEDFDRVMMWGFGWQAGPFAMIDAIGADAVGLGPKPFHQGRQILGFDGQYVAAKEEPVYRTLTEYPLIERGETFNVRDLGEGVTGIGVTTKMGVVTPALIRELTGYLRSSPPERMVYTSEAKAFSVGFDLGFFLEQIDARDWGAVDAALTELQGLTALMGTVPSVAALFGYALGGGLEIAIGCTRLAAAPEAQIGFPESKVGLIPGGSGTVRMRLWHQDSAKSLSEAARHLVLGTIAANADDARRMGIVRPNDVTVYHPDRLITDARRLALSLEAEPWPAWAATPGPVGGMIDRELAEMQRAGDLTEHDVRVGERVKAVFAKPDSLDAAQTREREGFIELLQEGLTQARIRHMKETGKPLRN